MKLQDKHREFAVKCYAKFMNTNATIDAFKEEFKDDIPKPAPLQQQQDINQYHQEVKQHQRDIKNQLYYQLRRYDITHNEFPKKYRELFHQIRKEYLTCYLLEQLQDEDTITNELETIYGFIKQRLFQNINSERTTENVKLAHSLLKTIATIKTGK